MRASFLFALAALLAACHGSDASKTWTQVCVDLDGDGFGLSCSQGDDCDDQNGAIHEGCDACSTPTNTGCACGGDGETVSCVNSRSVNEQGNLLCELGTRTCRSGTWSSCENLTQREVPAQSALHYRAIIDPDAAAVKCDPCHPDCYKVDDPLAEFDGTIGDNIVSATGGGVTIYSAVEDGGVLPAPTFDYDACVPGVAPDQDCDGILDLYDPYPDAAPFATTHKAIFIELEPGESEAQDFDIRFSLNTADIYLYLDMTASMDGERTNLLNSFLSGNYLPDAGAGVDCADRNQNGSVADEEYLKDGGIVGNLACIIRDSWLGAGWHRDIPFGEFDTDGFAYGPDDFEVYKHEVDISNDVSSVFDALGRFRTRGGINRPEGGIMGVHMIATGKEMYTGWNRPGNPARTDCPAGRWGYPCFRADAVPIVVWVTDAPITNGPDTLEHTLGGSNNYIFNPYWVDQKVDWPTANTKIDVGTGGKYYPITVQNDTFATAVDLGDINNSFKTYVGDTTSFPRGTGTLAQTAMNTGISGMCTDGTVRSKGPYAWSDVQQGAPNAFYKFKVTDASEPIVISTRGGHTKTSVAIIDAARVGQTGTTSIATNTNNTAGTALDLGTINPKLTNTIVSGTTASGLSLFTRDAVGTCLAQNTGSGDRVATGVVKFRLSEDMPNGIRLMGDANYALATGFYQGTPGYPTDSALSSVNVAPAPSGTGSTSGGNANDVFDSYNIGDLVGRNVRLTGGTTNTANLTSNYSDTFFTASPACTDVQSGGKDAVVDFSLSAPRRVRIEGTGNNATLAAGFDHVIALVRRDAVSTAAFSNNYTDATAGVIDLATVPSGATGGAQFTGVLGGTPSDYYQSELAPFATASTTGACGLGTGPASTLSQAVHVIDVTGATAGSYDFETGGSAASTYISLTRGFADSQLAVAPTDPVAAGQVQDLGTIMQRSYFVQGASMATHTTNAADFINRNNFACASGPNNNGGVDAVYSFRVDTARTIRISTVAGTTTATPFSPGTPGFNSHAAVFQGSISALTRISGGCDDQSGNGYVIPDILAVPGVTYYVVVKHINTSSTALTGTTAAYGLWLRDITFADNFVSCNYASQVNTPTSVRASRVTANLAAGRYYVVVKGTAATNYKLTVRKTTTSMPALIGCDRHSVAPLHSALEYDLPAGDYAVITRGVTATDVGTYNLILRDTSVAASPSQCTYDGNTGLPAIITTTALVAQRNGQPVDYYALVRGNTSTGAYTMYIEDASFKGTRCGFDNCYWYHNDPNTGTVKNTFDVNNGEWTGTLPLGDYYAVIKGEDETDVATNTEDDDYGTYQLSIGDAANHTSVADYAQARWLGPNNDGASGVRKELLDRGIRLVTVDSTRGPDDDPWLTDDPYYSNQQMSTMALETHATRRDGTPLFFKINRDGTGLGSAIVQGISELAGALAMNVTARLVMSPDHPSPPFGFLLQAVDMPGDGCDPPIDADNDASHTPDTHVGCIPGATPKFRVRLTNPAAPNNVPYNSADPNGGWKMRLELIGDNQYVVDSVPVYIVVENVVADPDDALFAPAGRYTQDTPASGCTGTEAPLWTTLNWEDTMPANTSLAWEICTAPTASLLNMCTFRPLATVTRGARCVTSASCPGGFCSAGGYCEYVAGPPCTRNADCGTTGTCSANRCQWTSSTIDLKPALTNGAQGERFLRSRLTLNANPARTQAPTVHTWGVKYTCTPQE